MTMPATASNAVDAARALLKQIQENFPVFRENKPLAIGIDKQLLAQMPDVNKKTLRIALGLHTGSSRYLKSMEKAVSRFNLDGTPAGDVDDTHRTHAAETLRARFKKAAEQKKAQQEALKAERQHAEKLRQLAEKFSPRH
ncbi:osmoprotectant transporter activator [Noviherbaspirillum sp. UKPF54]|nr:osmoprotectant transporter activator [Noviherbaspirillum sp. UKPF54]